MSDTQEEVTPVNEEELLDQLAKEIEDEHNKALHFAGEHGRTVQDPSASRSHDTVAEPSGAGVVGQSPMKSLAISYIFSGCITAKESARREPRRIWQPA